MEETYQVLRFKIFSRKQSVQPEEQPICTNGKPSCKNCRHIKSKTCGHQDERLKCKKLPPIEEPSLSSIKDSVSANCYSCCCNLKEFFKEVFKAISGDPKNRVCDVLGEMSDLLLALANDCVFVLKRICQCVMKNWTEDP